MSLNGKDVPFVWRPACSMAFAGLRDALIRAPILSFPTEDGDYILDTGASNFGLGGVLSQHKHIETPEFVWVWGRRRAVLC